MTGIVNAKSPYWEAISPSDEADTVILLNGTSQFVKLPSNYVYAHRLTLPSALYGEASCSDQQ